MLRITLEEEWGWATIHLEGSLSGPWVGELQRCWEAAMASPGKKPLLINLKTISFVDEPGRALLQEMHQRGARLVGQGTMTGHLVDQIERQPRDETSKS
jgi:hypothetical protein